MRIRAVVATLGGLLFAAFLAGSASAECTKLGFSVNDYGKEGPTRDAKALLDKYIAKWTAEKGIKNYKVGQKEVTCELFLNFIVFDEHTCKAEANVCWSGGPVGAGAKKPTTADAKRTRPHVASTAKKTAKTTDSASSISTGSVKQKSPAKAAQ